MDEARRRLAGILAADVVDYSAKMGANEPDTLALVRTLRTEVIEPSAATHGGRLFKTMGDGFLVEFPSAVQALRCAIAIQTVLNAQADGLRLRIGVHQGEVVAEGDDLFGDGVIIASRLEPLAEDGGIVISSRVKEDASGKLTLEVDDLGEPPLKNVAARLNVYRVRTAGARIAASSVSGSAKPSILVLPFTNMSGAQEEDYFTDGLTEDILTELSRFRELFVISRNTSFKFKGQAVDVKKVARELDVQYVVEGSVRKAGKRVRVTVQLIDAESDHHVWAERYDRDLEDIFALQDEVTSAIVATLPGRMEAVAHSRTKRKPTSNMVSYECVLEAKILHHRSSREDNLQALTLIRRAIELDPNYAQAHAWHACILGQQWGYGWYTDEAAVQSEAVRELGIALALDENNSDVHRILAAVAVTRNDLDKAVYHEQRALNLNANDDLIVVQQGEILTWLGQGEEGIEWIRKAMRLNPYHPERFWFHLARAQFVARRYADAIESMRHITVPDGLQHALLAACYAQLSDTDQAAAHAAKVVKCIPDFAIREHCLPMLHYRHETDLTHHLEALRKAGLSE